MRFTKRTAVWAGLTWLLAGAPAAAQVTPPQDTLAQDTLAQDAPAQAGAIEVTRAVVATGVQDREPVDEATSFGADVGAVYFYTVLEGDFEEQQLEHVWLRDGEEVARVPLVASGPRWRTWSRKTIPADFAGEWTVKVVNAAGEELESVDFTVGQD